MKWPWVSRSRFEEVRRERDIFKANQEYIEKFLYGGEFGTLLNIRKAVGRCLHDGKKPKRICLPTKQFLAYKEIIFGQCRKIETKKGKIVFDDLIIEPDKKILWGWCIK